MADIISRDAYAPAVKVVVCPAATPTVILGPFDLLRFDKKCFTVKNTGANTLSTVSIQASAKAPSESPGDTDFEVIDTSLNGLTAGSIKSKQIADDSRRTWRVVVTAAAGGSEATGYLTAGAV